MKKNGFTLIELLAVIVILGVLLLIAVPAVNKIMDSSKQKAFKIEMQSYINSVKNERILQQYEDHLYRYDFKDIEIQGNNKKSIYGSDYVYGYVLVNRVEGKDEYYVAACDKKGHIFGELETNKIIAVKEDDISKTNIGNTNLQISKPENIQLVDKDNKIDSDEGIYDSNSKRIYKYLNGDIVEIELSNEVTGKFVVLGVNEKIVRALYIEDISVNTYWNAIGDKIEEYKNNWENVNNITVPLYSDIVDESSTSVCSQYIGEYVTCNTPTKSIKQYLASSWIAASSDSNAYCNNVGNANKATACPRTTSTANGLQTRSVTNSTTNVKFRPVVEILINYVK